MKSFVLFHRVHADGVIPIIIDAQTIAYVDGAVGAFMPIDETTCARIGATIKIVDGPTLSVNIPAYEVLRRIQ